MGQRNVIGIDVGGTKIAYGLFDEHGILLNRSQYPTDIKADGPSLCDSLIETVTAFVKENGLSFKHIDGIGICLPSYVKFDEGFVCMTTAIIGMHDFPMREYLETRLPVRIVLDNDSNAAALAEHRHGAGKGSRHMVYVATSTGVGSGIIIEGKLFRGSYGWAGECGHMLATPDEGVLCGCENKGCFMSYVGGRFAPDHVKLNLEKGIPSTLSSCDQIDCEAILKAYENGDCLAGKMVESMAHWLAVCVYNVYQLLNINLFVFGGGLVHFGNALFGRMRKEFNRFDHLGYPVEFKFAELGKDCGIVGAAELVRE
ncbi:ROK family protein [Parasphaerochaeta coccoides]|uniref:Glucokinase n=1 Tax=Parasphaerochaeta coccoides (strain ATCC BAA-1237 / DSM 17374 / SPN1) TaxID=760011 RepID=F4GJ41_PARC1|nr:ROK family protein [Parasphaerochaeta coccoides]AEC01336.1 Glucokinase [Parasphaerochaeta coccoides DSM 17374]